MIRCIVGLIEMPGPIKAMKRQIIIINGGSTYDSYAEYLKHLKGVKLDFDRLMRVGWKDSFARKLGEGFQVIQPKMPNPNNAKYVEWVIWFRKITPFIKSGAVLVGHSLGGIFLTKYLSTHSFPKKIRATILIASPFHKNGMEESLGDFKLSTSLRKFTKQGGKIFIYHSTDDPVVPVEHAEEYHKMLPSAVLRIFKNKAHFNQSSFPELVKEIRSL